MYQTQNYLFISSTTCLLNEYACIFAFQNYLYNQTMFRTNLILRTLYFLLPKRFTCLEPNVYTELRNNILVILRASVLGESVSVDAWQWLLSGGLMFIELNPNFNMSSVAFNKYDESTTKEKNWYIFHCFFAIYAQLNRSVDTLSFDVIYFFVLKPCYCLLTRYPHAASARDSTFIKFFVFLHSEQHWRYTSYIKNKWQSSILSNQQSCLFHFLKSPMKCSSYLISPSR